MAHHCRVGFSYCTIDPCINTDESQAEDVHTFLVNFFQAYSEFAALDFYITGESCLCSVPLSSFLLLTMFNTDAGIYIPLIMQQIDLKGGVNLKGAAIGNGCIGKCFVLCPLYKSSSSSSSS